VTAVKSYYENAEDCPYFLIKADPRCPECAAIMVWRSAHRWITITNGAEIKVSDYGWGGRHLHMRDACGVFTTRSACSNARNGRGRNGADEVVGPSGASQGGNDICGQKT
jgi:hypothetical protein